MMPKSTGRVAIGAWVGNRPVVMLTGRANAGKSTLFNRIVGGARAIVSPVAGTTRDLNVAITSYEGREFVLVDSGGLELYAREPATERAMEEALDALGTTDLIVLVIDGRAGVSAADEEIIALLRQLGRPMIVAANKIDNPSKEAIGAEAWSLGIESVTFISAAHGHGIHDLLEKICTRLPPHSPLPRERTTLRLALIGRPNVGKSSLLNRLSGFARAVVDERPGTTRDPVEIEIEADGHRLQLIDTAGIRRPTKVEGELEYQSVGRAITTIRRAEVLALVIDAAEGFTDQDARLARLVDSNDRALVVVSNKWDLAARAGRRVSTFVRDTRERYPFLEFAPVAVTSAFTGNGVEQIIPLASKAGNAWRAEFRTVILNRILAEAIEALDPPIVGGRRLKPMYVTQVGKGPPRLAVFSNRERDIPSHYLRFLEGRFRTALGLEGTGTPLRIEFRHAGSHRTGPDRLAPNSKRVAPRRAPAPEHDLERD
jgi:GTPase